MTARRQDVDRPQDLTRPQDPTRPQALDRPQDRRSDRRRQTFNERLATGGWLLYAVELLLLVLVFGWMFLTNSLAGG